MSRRKKNRYGSRSSTTATASAPEGPQAQAIGWGWSGYAGANQTQARGVVQFPEMDTRRELDDWSRSELIRKIRFLARNEGVIKGFINNAPRFVGWRTPRAKTQDEEWNREAYQRFEDRCGNAAAFDIAGKFDFWTAQSMLLRCAFTDGDILTALSETAGQRAMFGFYEAHQLATPKNGKDGWADGVLTDKHGRHLGYGLRDGASGNGVSMSARDAYYFGHFDSPGHVRAVPPLAHAVNHLLDRMEIRADMKTAIKGSSLASMIREKESAAAGGKSKDGLPGILGTATAPNGGSYGTAQVWAGGQILDMPDGVTAKILHDERPSPNQMEAMNSLVRDAAIGFGLPPEVLYEMGRMTGPGIRFVMDVADSWVKAWQAELDKWCTLVWTYTIAKEMKYGGLRRPRDPRWWAVEFSGTRNLTIDRSKELKTRMEVVEAGYDTAENFCEDFFGTNADDVDRAHIARIKKRMELCEEHGVPFERAFPPRQGAAAPAAVQEEDPEKEEEPEEEEEPSDR